MQLLVIYEIKTLFLIIVIEEEKRERESCHLWKFYNFFYICKKKANL